MKKTKFFIFLFLMLLPSVYSAVGTCENIIFQTSFPDLGGTVPPFSYSSSSPGNCAGTNVSTINSIFETYAFGVNITNGNGRPCTGTGFSSISTSISDVNGINFSFANATGTVFYRFNFTFLRNSGHTVYEDFTVGFSDGAKGLLLEPHNGLQSKMGVTNDFDPCEMWGFPLGETYQIELEMDLDDQLYTLWVNGQTNGSCYQQSLSNSTYTWNIQDVTITSKFKGDDASENLEYYIDDISFCSGTGGENFTSVDYSCDYPTLFCDDFEYSSTPIHLRQSWEVYNRDNSFNDNFRPNGTHLEWNSTSTIAYIYHDRDPFQTNFVYDESTDEYGAKYTITSSDYAPTFSHEIDFMIDNHSLGYGSIILKTFDMDYDTCAFLSINSSNNDDTVDIYFYNLTNEWVYLYSFPVHEQHSLKMNTHFSSRNKTDLFKFNTSYNRNYPDIFFDNLVPIHYGLSLAFNPSCDTIKHTYIVKENWDTSNPFYSNLSIDIESYYFMVGTDQNIYVDYDLIENVAPNKTTAPLTGSTGVRDFAEVLDEFWSQWGIVSAASKIILSLFILLVVTMSVIFFSMSTRFPHPLAAASIIDIFVLFLLTYIRLMPVWITVVFVIFSAGLGVVLLRTYR